MPDLKPRRRGGSMSRLIDANEVVKAILEERDKIPRTITTAPYELGTEKPYHAGDQMRGGIRKALRCIEQAPTVDAVPVVRCRECKHHRDKNEQERQYLVEDILICTSPDATEDCWNAVWPDHFCSYGEKEGAG